MTGVRSTAFVAAIAFLAAAQGVEAQSAGDFNRATQIRFIVAFAAAADYDTRASSSHAISATVSDTRSRNPT